MVFVRHAGVIKMTEIKKKCADTVNNKKDTKKTIVKDMKCDDLCFLKKKHKKSNIIVDEAHDSNCDCGED
jgi:hypothetical protein